ncbi:hypothetical protein BH24ACT5_BH24ACT5_00730 [soil metagenome]
MPTGGTGVRTRIAAIAVALVVGLLGVTAPTAAAPNSVDTAPPTAAGLPEFLQMGSRLTWYAGDSTVQGARLVADPNGWILRNGQRYRVETSGEATAGVGYEQLNIVSNSEGAVVADQRFFLITDLQTNDTIPATSGVVTGTQLGIGQYWIAPQLLATMTEGVDGGTTTAKIPLELNGQQYAAISISTSTANTYAGYTYDLATGLLLTGGTMVAGDDVQITDGNGALVDETSGTVSYSNKSFVSTRQLDMPWAGQPLPEWAVPGTATNYEGTFRLEFFDGTPGSPPVPITATATFDTRAGTAFVGRLTSATNVPGTPSEESTSDRVYSASAFDGIWFPPAALAQFQPQQVLDNDATTGYVTTFTGVSGTNAVILRSGGPDEQESFYDVNTGLLTFVRSGQSTPGVGVQITELTLTGQTAGD